MASSSTSLMKASYQYDVFLSFSGEDTRKNFIDHLYDALQRHGIHTFKDDERLTKGKSISDQLLKSIEESKLFIIVFSKKYASSSWCLNELVKIMECQKSNEQIAYPVFYDVDPSEVRKQSGVVGEALAKHTNKETGKWREALTEAANLSGWDLENTSDGYEAKVIKLIVEQISLDLRSTNVNLDDNLVGMEPRLQDLHDSLDISLDDVRMIGIKGMGGAGKTTLAKATFDRILVHFEAKSFVENVREVSKGSSGLLSLQKKILSDLLEGQGNNISSVHEGTNMMKTNLRGRKVLVVLDDVDHKDQLEALAGDLNWFKPGSRIIITTRDEQVLIAHRVKWIHDVNLLSDKEAIGLFSRNAFGKDIPTQEFEKQSLQVVRYAAGLPLTVKVLGSFLCGKDMPDWIDALKRLEKIPLKETLEKLELSYESLEEDYKEIFLDIACLHKGQKKNEVINILESCGFYARNGLKVLEQRSLITFEEFDYLSMHDHIEEMGKNIVRRLHPDEPNKHSRMWIQEEIEDVLGNDMGTEVTRCMKLRLTREIALKGLGKMKKLRCLIIVGGYPKDCNGLMKDGEVIQFFPNSLQYLSWHDYQHWCLPETFRANNLVMLDMEYSNIEQLWAVMKKLESLRLVETHMLKTLDLRLTPNLVRLDLSSCYSLVDIHVPVGGLKRLLYLHLGSCKWLKSFSFIKELESLEELWLNKLYLEELPDIISSHSNSRLRYLYFSSNYIKNLPSSIGNLKKLVHLDLGDCKKLRSLPERICSLQHLRVLDLSSSCIEEFPEDIGKLECLESLDLSFSKIKHIPDSICRLKHLKNLALDNCHNLEKLPENLGDLECLEKLTLSFSKIRKIPSSICKLKYLQVLDLFCCSKLERLPKNLGDLKCLTELCPTESKIKDIPSNICKLKHVKELRLFQCSELEKLPENLGDLECLEGLDLSHTKIREIPSSICKLKHLKEFSLFWCLAVEKLPKNLGDLKCLERLYLSNTKIRKIPSSICKLKHLKVLLLCDCSELNKLPKNIGDLKCLKRLELWNTPISHLPHSISSLEGLQILGYRKRTDPNALLS